MSRTIAIGRQDFEKIRINGNFYVDKTDFIRQWWEEGDDVTLITRSRRFGLIHWKNMVCQSKNSRSRIGMMVLPLAVKKIWCYCET